MAERATPLPGDPRWTRSAITLLDAVVLLDLPYDTARRWTVGATRTVLGTTVQVARPLAPAIVQVPDDIRLPLVGVCQLTLLTALVDAGAPQGILDVVILPLEDDEDLSPLAAHRSVREVLPEAMAFAAEDRDVPDLLAPLEAHEDGWRFGPTVRGVLDGFDYDDDGWVTALDVFIDGVARTRITADGPTSGQRAPADLDAAVVTMFRDGHSVVSIAVALGCAEADVEAALRRRL